MGAVVRGSFTVDVPADILERLARRVDEQRFFSRGDGRTHAIAETPQAAPGYRVATPPERTLHVVAVKPSALEDVRFDLAEGRLRYEVRFPRQRRALLASWTAMVGMPGAFAILVAVECGLSPWTAAPVVVVAAALVWFLDRWFTRDLRESIRDDVARIVREEAASRRLESK